MDSLFVLAQLVQSEVEVEGIEGSEVESKKGTAPAEAVSRA